MSTGATINGFFNTFNTKIEAPVRSHLKNVYASLMLALLSAGAGGYVHVFTELFSSLGIIGALASLGLAVGLHATRDTGKNRGQRMAMLLGFAFLSGLGMGPLLEMSIRLNPTLVPTAFMLSSVIFACFSGASLLAPSGKYLYLGGTLFSAVSALFWMGLANLFFQSQIIFQAYLLGGLLVFCGFIMWDTQMIIERCRRGDRDFIGHSLDLLIDFFSIFRKILILLMHKEKDSDEKRRRR